MGFIRTTPLLLALLGQAVPLTASGYVEGKFSEDNLMTPIREDPTKFFNSWHPNGGRMDSVPFSRAGEPANALLDALHPFPWENSWQGPEYAQATRGIWWASYVASVFYLISLYVGQRMMKDRKPFDLKGLLCAWNLFLSVFSFIGAVRCGTHLIMMLSQHGFDYTLCRTAALSYGSGPVGLWTMLFVYSKYFELIDTVFLVLRKKKVGFLHWYHHFTVLTYCWHSYSWEMPSGIYFVAMNYTVHAVMYFYYFLAAVCKKPPKWALAVTIMQLSQMAVGIYITVSHVIRLQNVTFCDGYMVNLKAAGLMYASYFYLFAEFLVKRYCLRSSKKKGD